MFEVIRDAFIWVLSWAVDRRLHSEEALRLLFLVGSGVAATLLFLYWRRFACRFHMFRRRLMPEDRYAGRYLQALWRNNELRYSFVTIFYNTRRRDYDVNGRTYSPAGQPLTEYKSTYVILPSRKEGAIEFFWRTPNASQGYTQMTLQESDHDYIQGGGRVVTLDAWPVAYPIRFKHMDDRYVREALGVHSPANASEEPEFIRKFHERFGAQVMEGFGGGAKPQTLAEAPVMLESPLAQG